MPTTRSSKRVARTLPTPGKHIALASFKVNTRSSSLNRRAAASPTLINQVHHPDTTRPYTFPPDRPSSHPYLNSPDLNRTTSALFLTGRDVRLPSPRTCPTDSGSMSSRPGSRPGSPIARAPSPLRPEIFFEDAEGDQKIKPGDIETIHLELANDGTFDMVVALRDAEKSDVRTRNVPMMFLIVLTKQLDEWGVMWVKEGKHASRGI
ncbi:hypothetical protein CERZMDRAFT_94222 [Cercospora zeae-maydis SCOH1-5]|uniref:Uncharacterized protein n=1 Tax=Cercospora zeae-maydis SCOH1-5 TaxID=717836 RepID=A0A6A6FQW2_9PEZI|nr:hypothetical protein CERZMDRAFT_94222 [Cercospora zeae-maydis SCOH1-5]